MTPYSDKSDVIEAMAKLAKASSFGCTFEVWWSEASLSWRVRVTKPHDMFSGSLTYYTSDSDLSSAIRSAIANFDRMSR